MSTRPQGRECITQVRKFQILVYSFMQLCTPVLDTQVHNRQALINVIALP